MAEINQKLWKVVVEISHSRSDGNGESSREKKTRFFDNFMDAEEFARSGDIASNNFFAAVIDAQVFEYDIKSMRKLEHKKHEIEQTVKQAVWRWE